jgi:hypothetical protein
MTDLNTSDRAVDRAVDRAIRSWLHEDRHEDVSRIAGAVLDQVDTTPQRRLRWPAWRTPLMNKLIPIGLGAAAVVVVAVVGVQLLGPTGDGVVGAGATSSPTPTATPQPSVTTSSRPADGSLPNGPFLITGADGPNDGGTVAVTVDIASPGWFAFPDFDGANKDDDGLDAPQSVGALLLAWSWPAGTGFAVFGDPCQWATTIPETPATTPDEIATAFAAQAQTDAAAPVDVTVGGYTGKMITLQVPTSYEVPGATREEEFADCDEDSFAFYGIAGAKPGEELARNAQGPGQIDELWILDVGGSIVILDATYGPAAPAELVDELRTMAESATFE